MKSFFFKDKKNLRLLPWVLFTTSLFLIFLFLLVFKEISEAKSFKPNYNLENVQYRINSEDDFVNEDGKALVFPQPSSEGWVGRSEDLQTSYLGLRFTGGSIPQDATLVSAVLEFTSSRTQSQSVYAIVYTENMPNGYIPPSFSPVSRPSQRQANITQIVYSDNSQWEKYSKITVDITKSVSDLFDPENPILSRPVVVLLKSDGPSAKSLKYILHNRSIVPVSFDPSPKLTILYKIVSSPTPSPAPPTPTTAPTPLPTTAPYNIVVVDSEAGPDVSAAIGGDGLPVISYKSGSDLKVVKCGNSQCSTGNIFATLDSNVRYTSIARGTDGFPVVAYQSETAGELKLVKCSDLACSSNNIVIEIGPLGKYTTMAIGVDGYPVVGYADSTGIIIIKCGNPACTSGNATTTVDSSNTASGFMSIKIGLDSLPVMSYSDSVGNEGVIKVLKCGNSFCTSGNTITALGQTHADIGHGNSLSIGTDGSPIIAYHYVAGLPAFSLGFIKCFSSDCSGAFYSSILDSGADKGDGTSTIIGSDGFPIISYWDGIPNYDLKITRCTDVSCSPGYSSDTIDSNGNVGMFTSMVIPSDDKPLIAYWDSGNNDLKVAKCNYPNCVH